MGTNLIKRETSSAVKRVSAIGLCFFIVAVLLCIVFPSYWVHKESSAPFNTVLKTSVVPCKIDGTVVSLSGLPVPAGDLNASSIIPLPDLYEAGKGFTCTGLAYDASSNSFLVGDIGVLLPNSGTIKSQIVQLSEDFETVAGTIPLYNTFPDMGDIQGITIDTSDGTIWFCAPSANKIYHTDIAGSDLGNISIARPTGIAYSSSDDSFWVLDYNNQILHISKTGTILEAFASEFGEALDQCFLDNTSGFLYITAGTNYTGRNNVYFFNISTHEQFIACTVDSYSVEGIWIDVDRMIIVNDGYYHSSRDPVNQANIYNRG